MTSILSKPTPATPYQRKICYEVSFLMTSADQAYRILQVGFSALLIIAGQDKFTHLLTHWNQFLAPIFPQTLQVSNQTFMHGVGVVEIITGLLVAVIPRIAAYVVMGWLWGIIVNLVLIGGYYDIVLRDFGLSLGALALGSLSWGHYQQTKSINPL